MESESGMNFCVKMAKSIKNLYKRDIEENMGIGRNQLEVQTALETPSRTLKFLPCSLMVAKLQRFVQTAKRGKDITVTLNSVFSGLSNRQRFLCIVHSLNCLNNAEREFYWRTDNAHYHIGKSQSSYRNCLQPHLLCIKYEAKYVPKLLVQTKSVTMWNSGKERGKINITGDLYEEM